MSLFEFYMKKRSQEIRDFIIQNVNQYSNDIAKRTAVKFSISRQAVNRHLNQLVDDQVLEAEGVTMNRTYRLRALNWQKEYSSGSQLAEDVVWRDDIEDLLDELPGNALDIWHYGFSEMFNNAIDHSDGNSIGVEVEKTAASAKIILMDDGVGIFKKIQNQFRLLDERHAVLELSKGKLTTDPDNHSGEGIFFTSRMFDKFMILSGETFFSHEFGELGDWILESEESSPGTSVSMELNNQISRTSKEIFDQYTSGEDYTFSKTIVPVRLAQYNRENLITRSQAKRLMARVEKFNTVVLDFNKIEFVGQAFTDEVFRVFPNRHQEIKVIAINANSVIQQMISRVQSKNFHT